MDIPGDTTTLVSSNSQPLYLQLTRYKSTTLTALKLWGCKLNRTMYDSKQLSRPEHLNTTNTNQLRGLGTTFWIARCLTTSLFLNHWTCQPVHVNSSHHSNHDNQKYYQEKKKSTTRASCNARDSSSIPGKIPQAAELSPSAKREATLMKSPCTTTRECPHATKTQGSQK